MTFYTSRADIIILAFSQRLANKVCLITYHLYHSPILDIKNYFIFIICLRSLVPIKKIFWVLKWDWNTRLCSQSQYINSTFAEIYTNHICFSCVNSHIYISMSVMSSGNQLYNRCKNFNVMETQLMFMGPQQH